MPPPFLLYMPHLAKTYAKAMEPTAVTSQETIESAPTCASFDGSMMMPEPIIFTAVRMVS